MAKVFVLTTILAGALWALILTSPPAGRVAILAGVVIAPAALRTVLIWRRNHGL